MTNLYIQGGTSLSGEVKIEGAKNSILVLMAAALLTNEDVILHNVPHLTDIDSLSDLLSSLGVIVIRQNHTLILNASGLNDTSPAQELVSKLRASFFCLGSLLARFGYVEMPLPGGCLIGLRPVDEHIRGIKLLGADVDIQHGVVIASTTKHHLIGSRVCFSVPSVGATETLIMASCLCFGETILENCAMDPEIVDLANLLNQMGAKVYGAGTPTIRILGVQQLHGTEYTIIPDRIEAGTYLLAGAITRSPITVCSVIPQHLNHILLKLQEIGYSINVQNDAISIDTKNPHYLKPIDIRTASYPGFPTDLQAPFLSLLSTIPGVSVVNETIYENRLQHTSELIKMGANIRTYNNLAIIEGHSYLTGAKVSGTDLRATAALALAGLYAQGETVVSGVEYLERGYSQFTEKLSQIGAKVWKDS
jgi:UDP-N-acetylglucosamine 1-carboxyvinyltransferase